MENEWGETVEGDEKLLSGIKFTRDDLSFNKQGMLTPSQIETLKNSIHFSQSTTSRMWLYIMGGGILIYFFQGGWSNFSFQSLFTIALVMGGYYLIFMLFNGSKLKKLEQGKIPVEKIEGVVHIFQDVEAASGAKLGQYGNLVTSASRFAGMNLSDYSYVVQVGEKKIYTTKNIHEAFEEGKSYRLYYIRTYKTEYNNIMYGTVIVSAERG